MKLSIILSVIIVSLVGGLTFMRKNEPKQVFLGVYDPNKIFYEQSQITIENMFFGWNVEPGTVKKAITDINNRNKIPLITLEPWQKKGDTEYLKNILKGNYDDYINNTCSAFSTSQTPVLIRWGHEMELQTNRYPWSASQPDEYINAYKYFVNKCRTYSQTAPLLFVWSPSGEEGLEKYWPGEQYVDLVGLSQYSFDEWDIKNVGHMRSFFELLSPKYERVKAYNKPIILAETATTGTDSYKLKWLNEGLTSLNKFPLVISVIYFNSKDVDGVWGNDYKTPDWSLGKESISQLKMNNLITIQNVNAEALTNELLKHIR